MPLRMPPDLLFAIGPTIPLAEEVVGDLLSMARKIQSSHGRQYVLEQFKKAFCRSSGSLYYPSSSEGWAESDLDTAAAEASNNAPGFINAFVEACESLQKSGAVVPDYIRINHVLAARSAPFRIDNGELIASSGFVAPPEAPQDAATVAARAFSEAAGLVNKAQAASAIDRIHTSLHAYLIEICSTASIALPTNATTTQIFRALRENHPSFQHSGPRQADVNSILRSFASVVDALSPIRNKASLAHANPLLDEPKQ